MKRLIIAMALTASSSAFANDPASQTLQDAADQAAQILTLKSVPARIAQSCDLIQQLVDAHVVGPALLGKYANSTDKAGVDLFIKMLPSFAMTKIMPNADKLQSLSIDQTDYDQGNGTVSVDVTAALTNGNSYSGEAIMQKVGSHFMLIDGTYMGFSGISYLAGDIQKKIDAAAQTNPNNPVSTFDQQLMADPNFIQCP